jgi:hypothetical protein
LSRDVLGAIQQRHGCDPDRDAGYRCELHRVGRGLLGWVVLGDDER